MANQYHEWTLSEANAKLKTLTPGTAEHEEIREIRELILVRDRARMIERITALEEKVRLLETRHYNGEKDNAKESINRSAARNAGTG